MGLDARYVINSVRLTSCPPVGDLEIRFENRMTLIAGENGVGKSSLVTALGCKQWPYGGVVEIDDTGDRQVFENANPICIIDDNFVPEQDDASTDTHWVCLAERHPQILEIAARWLNQLLRPKLGGWMKKFANVPDYGDQTFLIKVRRGHRPLVVPGMPLRTSNYDVPSCYSGISDLFVAAGERFMVHLAGVLAAREYLAARCPLILDSAFGMLDEFHCAGVMSILEQLEDQVIVLDNPCIAERLNNRSNSDFGYVAMKYHKPRE